MDVSLVLSWLVGFTVICAFLGGLTVWIQRHTFLSSTASETMNPIQRGNAKTRRKQARLASRKKSLATTTTTNEKGEQEEEGEEEELNSTETGFERDDEDDRGEGDEEEENGSFVHDDDTNVHTKRALSSSGENTKVATKLQPTSSLSAMQEEQNFPSKPQASVAPVKQSSYYAPYSKYESNSRYNGYSSSYNYSNQNSLPPRFQQQRQQREAATQRRYRGRRGQYRSPTFYHSSRYPDDYDQSERDLDEPINDQYSSQQDSGMPNDDSSESENLSGKVSLLWAHSNNVCADVPSTSGTTSLSPNLSTSTESPNSLRGLELIRSAPPPPAPLPPSPHTLLDDLLSIFDNASFSPDELELLISKIATKHILNKQDIHRMLSNAKSEMSLERILDETYLSQVKILAIELKSEKNRVLELAKSNAEMDHAIRQLQQQQQTIPSVPQCQQMIMQHQMQLRRMSDENARLQHQLHSYAMLPASINELRQQHQILGEQFRQLSLRNAALENEAAESERASKHAAEIYKKGQVVLHRSPSPSSFLF